MSTKAKPTMADSKPSAAKDDNVDKIRDILFGSQSRDFDRRFGDLDGRLNELAATFKADLDKRFSALESYARREFEKLTERLKVEQSERFEELKTLEREVRDGHKDQLKRLGALDAQLAKDALELRNSIEDQARAAAQALGDAELKLRELIKANVQSLGDEKVARLDLADLLGEVALKLKREFDLKV
jgi:DNA anti-recombination protein RmuC